MSVSSEFQLKRLLENMTNSFLAIHSPLPLSIHSCDGVIDVPLAL